jgi:hypothetical protein
VLNSVGSTIELCCHPQIPGVQAFDAERNAQDLISRHPLLAIKAACDEEIPSSPVLDAATKFQSSSRTQKLPPHTIRSSVVLPQGRGPVVADELDTFEPCWCGSDKMKIASRFPWYIFTVQTKFVREQ